MAVGQCDFPIMPSIAGITLGTTNAGIKQTIRDDILLLHAVEGATCAGVFTQNAFCAAPVHVAKANLAHKPRWFLINSGNANAGTGELGMQAALTSCEELAKLAGDAPNQVLPFSTGVIGQLLPVAKITAVLPAAIAQLSSDNWANAAKAIMTTDTFPKGVTKTISIAGETITFNGISKGAGMIQPNMALLPPMPKFNNCCCNNV
jgi:glutamate N-acetyltransferase/amino-acid N-acetyltransferase